MSQEEVIKVHRVSKVTREILEIRVTEDTKAQLEKLEGLLVLRVHLGIKVFLAHRV
jgi:hypothetical protein